MMQDEDTFGDDEFFDRTLVKKRKDNDGEATITAAEIAEDFHSLKRKLEDLIVQRKNVNEQILAISMNKPIEEDPELDELDKFMAQNEEKSRDEKKLKLINTLKDIEIKITEYLLSILHDRFNLMPISSRTQKLLKIVQPAFVSDEAEVERRLQQQEAERREQIKRQGQQRIEREREHAKKMQQIKEAKAKGEPSATGLNANLSLAEQKEQKIKDDTQEAEAESNTVKKVYSAPQKPPPRNLKEKDFEEKQPTQEWVPPSEANQKKLEDLKKKLGY